MILLKKEVNELFEAEGLGELTVANVSGNLAIVGRKCGQPVMIINDIAPKQTMTKAVRDIVLNDYILPVLSKHKKDFKDYIATRKKVRQLTDEVEELTSKVPSKFKIESANYAGATALKNIRYSADTEKSYPVSILMHGENKEIQISHTPLSMVSKIPELIKDMEKALEPVNKKVAELAKATKAADKAQEKLRTVCGW